MTKSVRDQQLRTRIKHNPSLWARLMLAYRNGLELRILKRCGVSQRQVHDLAKQYGIKRKYSQYDLFR